MSGLGNAERAVLVRRGGLASSARVRPSVRKSLCPSVPPLPFLQWLGVVPYDRAVMKLIIQIPCYNEEKTLPETLADLPREVPGFDAVEWLIIDDGSADATAEVAKQHGVDHVVRHAKNLGLARAFMTGLDACLERGADAIVNTDADNQYVAADIPRLVAPIADGSADIVVGTRPIGDIEEFSALKKLFQRLGSWVVRKASHTPIEDAPSGFRAFSRSAAMQLNVFSEYTYTLETIIQAGMKGIAIMPVPIRVNPSTRPSRLVRSIPSYLKRSAGTIVRISMTYRPLQFFLALGSIPFVPGLVLALRFFWFYIEGQGDGHVQSLILASLLMSFGFILWIVALLADLISVNRKLLEELSWRIRRAERSSDSE